MEPVREPGHDSEVPASAPDGPEQVRVLRAARPAHLAVRCHNLDLEEVVHGPSVTAGGGGGTAPPGGGAPGRPCNETQYGRPPPPPCVPLHRTRDAAPP